MLSFINVANGHIALLAIIWLLVNVGVALLPFGINVVLYSFFGSKLEILQLIHKGELFVFTTALCTVGISDIAKTVLSQEASPSLLTFSIGLGLFINLFFSLLVIGFTKMREEERKRMEDIEAQLKKSSPESTVNPLFKKGDDLQSGFVKNYRRASYFCAGMAVLMTFTLFFQGLQSDKTRLEEAEKLRNALQKQVESSKTMERNRDAEGKAQEAGQKNGK